MRGRVIGFAARTRVHTHRPITLYRRAPTTVSQAERSTDKEHALTCATAMNLCKQAGLGDRRTSHNLP